MSNLYANNAPAQRQHYEQQFRTSRLNLLIVTIFSFVNILLLITNSDLYFLFSAFIPYFIAGMGMILCGRFPEEYYVGELEGMVFFDNTVFVILLVIAFAITLLYLLAWFMSKNKKEGWLIFALVLFGLDTLMMFSIDGFSFDSIIDILFHAWVIYYLVIGISSCRKLKLLPAELIVQPMAENAQAGEGEEGDVTETAPATPVSPIIRVADMGVKHRVLLSANVMNYDICYRRVNRTNELVVNGNVYDELVALLEKEHVLRAYIDGHCIEVGLRASRSFIAFDGEIVAKKMRLY